MSAPEATAPVTTRGELMRATAAALSGAGIALPRLEARLLLAYVIGISPEAVFSQPAQPVAAADAVELDGLLGRRRRGEPMAYILGEKEFWSLPFRVTPEVLIPRPDTEIVVETALRTLAEPRRPLRIVDLGTGSGCILLALLSELPEASGIGVDRSEQALLVARGNARRLGLDERCAFVCADWAAAIDASIDLAVSNPPYIATGDHEDLDVGVRRFEPPGALRAGPDGLSAYRRLGPDLARLLKPGASAVIEIGDGQAAEVSALMASFGLRTREAVRDLAGKERCLRLAA